jgi:endoglucanase
MRTDTFLLSTRTQAHFALTIAFFAVMLGLASCKNHETAAGRAPQYPNGSPVARHGALRVVDRQLCDKDGAAVLLRGVSTHDLTIFGRFATRETVRRLAQEWHVSLFRAVVYLNTYPQHRAAVDARLDELVSACAENGIYIILDWHVLSEKNPQVTQEEARVFFSKMAERYGKQPHVLYEICNEPNGKEVTWHDNVKPYAEAVIPVIRTHAPDSLVIVGTPTWAQDVDLAAQEPLKFENVTYALHFYAGSHGEELQRKVEDARRTISIFCSEWGTTLANGDGGPFSEKSTQWLDFIESRGISWCNWSLSDAKEASAIFRHEASLKGADWSDQNLSASGAYVRNRLSTPPAPMKR